MNHAEDNGQQQSPHISEKHETEKSSAYTITPQKSKRKTASLVRELIQIALIAILVVLPIRFFIAQPFAVSGASMSPAFESGDYLIIDELSYHVGNPARFDVVVFRFPNDPSKFFIKRVIGLPGETISVSEKKTIIFSDERPQGLSLEEPYVIHTSPITIQVSLEEGEYFVMGDNRASSSDSRIWGPLPRDNIVGRAFLRLLPATNADLYPGAPQTTQQN